VLSTAAGPELASHLKGVRDVLAEEAHRIRGFVEATRKIAPAASGLVKLEPDILKRVERLRELWSCDIQVEVSPPDLRASLTTTRNISHMIGEAVANAARHGRARLVKVRIESRADRILLGVQDDGNGFENLTGGFSAADLATENAGPKSLKARVDDLGGTLYLSSSTNGTSITVELPA
jgi:signal transduction histidine kinase